MEKTKPRLKEEFNKKIAKELQKELEYASIMAVPHLKKIVINSGVGEAVDNKVALEEVVEILTKISGQKPIITKAKKAISTFKIRKGQEIGAKVTLRGDRMWYFFDKLVNIVFPRVKDFRGLPPKAFDGSGNYSVGIEEHTVFPEIDTNKVQKVRSLQVILVIKSLSDEDSKKFLEKFGFPFAQIVQKKEAEVEEPKPQSEDESESSEEKAGDKDEKTNEEAGENK
ncbi:50S ribosomal protein L5 [Candidatus Dojkabacteria bacterium]|nr:50S ribosomal protein L5 [Candidatus Dojkabacteria bacterium]